MKLLKRTKPSPVVLEAQWYPGSDGTLKIHRGMACLLVTGWFMAVIATSMVMGESPEAMGACCLGLDDCLPEMTAKDCEIAGGLFMGRNSICESTNVHPCGELPGGFD